jgi:hypothetical protein
MSDEITLSPEAKSAFEAWEARKCICREFSATACWRQRYNLDWDDDVQEDGGPCMCACHDIWGDEDDE